MESENHYRNEGCGTLPGLDYKETMMGKPKMCRNCGCVFTRVFVNPKEVQIFNKQERLVEMGIVAQASVATKA